MASQFLASSSVDSRAQIAADVKIGPFCVIGPDVSIRRGTRLESHVTLGGRLTVGEDNHIHSGAVIGQSVGARRGRAEYVQTVIGNHNTIREGVTIAAGSSQRHPTTIGNQNLVMAFCQIDEGCRLGDRISIANGSILDRHVSIHDNASLSGRVVISECAVIGSMSFTSIASHVVADVPPFVIVEGVPSQPRCLNTVGLARNGFSPESIQALGIAYRLVFRAGVDLDGVRSALASALRAEPRLDEFLRYVETHRPPIRGESTSPRRARQRLAA